MKILKSASTQGNVLLIEDDENDRLSVRSHLELMGFVVYDTPSSVEGREIFLQRNYSLVLIHLGHAPLRALEMCRWVKAASTVPILMFICRTEVVDAEMVMTAGADDYISKPISSKILTSRVNQQYLRGGSQQVPKANILTWGSLKMDLGHHRFLINDKSVALTSTEFQFLQLLMENPQRVFTRKNILDAIGVLKGIGTDHIVDSHASRIRTKVRVNDGPEVIAVVRSVGFRLADPFPMELGAAN